uniref:Uncharacterized protein n=1 Tax=Arion vulgaris TaxID=1028688 RepID=A0A0B7BMU5_9EUPU
MFHLGTIRTSRVVHTQQDDIKITMKLTSGFVNIPRNDKVDKLATKKYDTTNTRTINHRNNTPHRQTHFYK